MGDKHMKKTMNLLMLALLLMNSFIITLPNVSAENIESKSIIRDINLLTEEKEVINEKYDLSQSTSLQLVLDLELSPDSILEELLLPKELIIDKEQSGSISLGNKDSGTTFNTTGQKILIHPGNPKGRIKGELRINVSPNMELIDMRNKLTFTLPLVGKSYEFTYSFESQSLEEDINLNWVIGK